MTKKKKNNYYIQPEDFQKLFVKRRELLNADPQNEKDIRKNHNEIGKVLYDIANNLSFRPNYINYTFREDMVSVALLRCLKALDNYDEVAYNNPFSYFTKVCAFAFIGKIKKENQYFKFMSDLSEKIHDDFNHENNIE